MSVAILPLLGNPRRTSSRCFLSTFPFNTVAGDAVEQHETVNLRVGEGVDDVVEKGETAAEGHWTRIV